MRRDFLRLALMAAGCVAVACGKKTPGDGASRAGRLRIAVIPKGTTHEFWKTVHAGAVKAARELDVDIVWKGPLKEDDLKSQVDLVQSFMAQRVAGICLAPLNEKALVRSVEAATGSGIPVVIFDSALASKASVSFVATDNRAAGRLAGERMAVLLGQRGKVVVLRYQEGSASTHEREQGFIEAVQRHPGIQIISDNQYGGATTESAFSASESLLLSRGAAKEGVSGVFTPNESTTFGMLLALQKAKLVGKVRMIGFDVSEKLLAGVRAGEIDALVLQDPFNMGYLAVKALVEHLGKKPVEPRTDTGATLLTRENLEDPKLRQLLDPELDKWLGK